MKKFTFLFAFLFICGCGGNYEPKNNDSSVSLPQESQSLSALPQQEPLAKQKTKVIYLIGDGAGPAIYNLLIEYARYVSNSEYGGNSSNLERIINAGRMAYVINGTAKTIVTDSAAAGTQLATGNLTNPGNLGVDKNLKKVENLAELAQKQGLATGVVTNTHITDATPAAFTAHVANRSMHDKIAKAYVEGRHNVVLGGGGKYFMNTATFSKEPALQNKVPYSNEIRNSDDVFDNYKKLLDNKYDIVFDSKQLQASNSDKVFGLFAPHGMHYEIERPQNEPSLSAMAEKAIEILSRNSNGFFLMIESGLIDWAAHANETGAIMKELLELDKLLGYLMRYIQQNPETLLVITADHDTGGVGFHYKHLSEEEYERKQKQGYELFSKTDGYSNGAYVAGITDRMDYAHKNNLKVIASQKLTYAGMYRQKMELDNDDRTPKNISKIFYKGTGLDLPEQKFNAAMSVEDFAKIFNEELGLFWSTHNHTSSPILTVYYGNNSALRGGVLQNTELHDTIRAFMQKK